MPAVRSGGAETLPEADVLLAEVQARMPLQPVLIAGTLHIKGKGRARGTAETAIEALLDFSRKPMAAEYTVRSGNGTGIEQLAVFWTRAGNPKYKYSIDNKAAAAPDMSEKVQNSDLTWLDLTLSFLWWKGGVISGTGEAKGRDCYIVKMKPPAAKKDDHGFIKLWIDKKHLMMMQAEEYADEGSPVRRVSVKSFKKIDDQWMIKDLEVRDLENKTRTVLRIDTVTPLSSK